MTEWRKLYSRMWTKDDVMSVSRDARLLFVGIVTLADDEGYFDGSGRALKAAIFPSDDDITTQNVLNWRNELVTAALLTRYEANGTEYVHLPGFIEKQKPRKDTRKPSNIKARIQVQPSCKDAVTEPLRSRNVDRQNRQIRQTRQRQKAPAASRRSSEPNGTTPKNAQNKILEAIRALWAVRFIGQPFPGYPWAQKTYNTCRAKGVSPRWVFKYASDHDARDPEAYIETILNGGDKRPMPDESGTSCDAWEEEVLSA